MTPFHIALHALNDRALAAASPLDIDGHLINTLDVAAIREADPFQISFEEIAEQLAAFDRLFLEPDGSFVWRGDKRGWQIDGLLFDHLDQVRYIELKGWCPEQSFRRITSLLRQRRETRLVVQLFRQATLLEASEFHRLVWKTSE